MANRQCGSCTLCCKVMGIQALDKPQGVWCPHCAPGKGCGIYQDRPQECADFMCLWLLDERLSEDWKPSKSKIVLTREGKRVVAYVDPSAPEAWRKPPYFETLNRMMQSVLSQGLLFYVSVAGRYTLLLPDRQEDMGLLTDADEVALAVVRKPTGIEYQVSVRKG